jgi:hypothetical protein
VKCAAGQRDFARPLRRWKVHLLLDKDGTISDDGWRLPLAESDGWDFYHAQLSGDKPVYPVLAFVRGLFFAGWKIHLLTATPERYREPVMKWCIQYSIPIERILMRANDDHRRSPDVKMDMVLNNFEGIPRSQMIALDDREDVALAYKSLDIVSYQLHRSYNVQA